MKFAMIDSFSHSYRRMVFLLIACFVPFALMRLALYLLYRDDFASLSGLDVLAGFVVGLKFDGSVIAMVLGLPLLMLALPFRWSRHVYWQRLWVWLIFVALLAMVFVMMVDAIYFGVVHRHVGSEVGALSADLGPTAMLALNQYWPWLLMFGLVAVLGLGIWRRLAQHIPPISKRWGMGLGLGHVMLGFFLLALVARGGVGGKPISVGDAFFSNHLSQGYLAMNGVFAVSRAFLDSSQPPKVFMHFDEAIERTRHFLTPVAQSAFDPQYPLYRWAQAESQRSKMNVVVLVLESWGVIHIDAYRKRMGLPALGVTPNFDQLAEKGRLYTRFYANGQRSIEGGAAILAGMPTLPGLPFLGEGMEQNRQAFLGELAQAQGYETLFLQSSDRASLRFDVIAARAGFSRYLANEDIAELHPKKKPELTWGTWDHNTLQAANQRFAAAPKPFLGYVFTSTSHTPWLIPDRRWEKYPGGADKDKALNAIFYVDWALGEMIATAKRDGYYDNTLFVLTADHASEFVEDVAHVPNLFHIPLLLVGPGVVAGVDDRVGSQVDILPTLVQACGWAAGYTGLGRSLLDNTRQAERASLSVRGNVINWITAKGWVSHDLERSVGAAANLLPKEAEEMERNLLATYQVSSRAQLDNQLAPNSPKRRLSVEKH